MRPTFSDCGQECKKVPAGRVTTYGNLAKVLDSSPRAVGQVRPD